MRSVKNSPMATNGPVTYDTLKGRSHASLYDEVKRERDKLRKRRERLRDAIAKEPARISKFGYNALQDLPSVDKNATTNQLKSTLIRYSQLSEQTTSTVRGARKQNEFQLRKVLGLPESGPLNGSQRTSLNEGWERVEEYQETQGVDVLDAFWNGFKRFQEENRYRRLQSGTALEEYRDQFNNVFESNATNPADLITDIYERVQTYSRDLARGEEARRDMERFLPPSTRRGGWR